MKYQMPTVKHEGGSLMVWGDFLAAKTGPFHRIHGIMDRFVFKDILKDVLVPFVRQGMPRGWIFQEDNDPKHIEGICKEY